MTYEAAKKRAEAYTTIVGELPDMVELIQQAAGKH